MPALHALACLRCVKRTDGQNVGQEHEGATQPIHSPGVKSTLQSWNMASHSLASASHVISSNQGPMSTNANMAAQAGV